MFQRRARLVGIDLVAFTLGWQGNGVERMEDMEKVESELNKVSERATEDTEDVKK